MATRRPLVMQQTAIDRWCQYVDGELTHAAEATGFVNFELSYSGELQRRTVFPEHYLVTFSCRDKGRQRVHTSLLSLRLTPEECLPESVQVGVEVRGRDGESVVCSGEYVEFELLSQVNDASKQPPLRICAGPVRMNSETQQREFMRIDLGRCVRQIVTDIVDDPRHKGLKLVRSRWWICVEVLRLVCSANFLDHAALDTPGVQPLEWVICLVDEKGAANAGGSSGGSGPGRTAKQDEKSIDELARYIDGGSGKKSKAKKKKKSKGEANGGEDDAEEGAEDVAEGGPAQTAAYSDFASLLARASQSAAAASASLAAALPRTAASGGYGGGGGGGSRPGPAQSRPAPPPGWSRTVDLAPALVDLWRDSAGCDVRHVAESTGLVHFMLTFSMEQCCRLIAPSHYVIAFPQLVGGQQRYHSALLTLRIVTDSDIPESTEDGAESIEFELLAREREAPVQTPLRFTAGPVRINEKTGQRESMRLDLGECVRWAAPDYVEGVVGGSAQRLVRQRWWVCVETLRLVCVANELDATGLDMPGATPLEWIACLVDDRTPGIGAVGGKDLGAKAQGQAGGAVGGGAEPKRAGATADAGTIFDPQKPKSGKKKGKATEPEAVPAAATSPPPAAKAAAKAMQQPPQQQQQKQQQQQHQQQQQQQRQQRRQQQQQQQQQQQTQQKQQKEQQQQQRQQQLQQQQEQKEQQQEQQQPLEEEEDGKRTVAAGAGGKPPPPSRTLALPSALIDSWCNFARKSVSHVAEATGFAHFELSYNGETASRNVSPEHYIIAFPNRDRGRQRYHSSLLTMRIVKESSIPPEHVLPRSRVEDTTTGDVEYVEFELLLRMHEAPVQQQLRITAGPVRVNPETGQRESMRIDLGRCVRQIATDVVDDPRGKRVVRNRWWICVETLRLVCTANSLECKALDEPDHPPVEWVVCLVDERGSQGEEVQQQEEERNIDDLVDFIDGKGGGSKKKKKKPKDREAVEVAPAPAPAPGGGGVGGDGVVAQAPTMSASQAAAAALSQAPLSKSRKGTWGPTVDPALHAQAAAQLLAECAASCVQPQQVAAAAAASAAAEAARRAAEMAAAAAAAAPSGAAVPAAAPAAAFLGRGGGGAAAAPKPRPAAADLLRAAEAAAAAARKPAAARVAAASAAARPLHGGWEPTPHLAGAEDWGLAGDDHGAPLHSAGAASRALDGLVGLESLLAGLRSEFADRVGDKRRAD